MLPLARLRLALRQQLASHLLQARPNDFNRWKQPVLAADTTAQQDVEDHFQDRDCHSQRLMLMAQDCL